MTQSIDFDRKLSEQLDFIRASAQAFDQGRAHEAIRIATALRVLFHDTDHSTSLCKHLGKSRLMLASTISGDPGDGDVFHGLVGMKGQIPGTVSRNQGRVKFEIEQGNGMMRSHPLGGGRAWFFVNFDQWWRKQIVFRNRSMKVCRRDVVLSAVNQDGGAHVDSKLKPKYEAIKKGFDIHMLVCLGKRSSPPQPGEPGVFTAKYGELHLSSIRQMAYEILASPDIVAHEVSGN